MLLIASVILILCGVAHSYLGERYIFIRLFRRENIPHLFGSDEFTKGTLRFCWHITSILWFGFAALLLAHEQTNTFLLDVVAVVFLLSSLFSIYFTKAKHLSWVAFLAVSLIAYFSGISV